MKLSILFFLLLFITGSTTTITAFVVPAAFCAGSQYHKAAAYARTSRLSVLLGDNNDDRFDMDELKQRISAEAVPRVFAPRPPLAKPPQRRPDQVNVILFHPHTQHEGMHTIEYPKGSGNNVILAFEDSDDCHEFAQLLKAQQFHDPTPKTMDLATLECYCQALGVYVQVVPRGTHLIPPSQNVPHFGHDPKLMSNKEKLGYLFEMSDVEVEHDLGAIVEEECASWE